jgi:predicted porin
MQKKLIALAVASLVSAPVFAQSQVQIYGIIDQAITSGNYGGGSVTQLSGSGYTTERLGFQGSEDLGNGLKANFRLETGFNSDTGYHDQGNTGWLFQRESRVGLSGNWGQVNFGRQYTPLFSIQAANDIFRVAGIGTNYQLTSTGMTRASNAIRYDSNSMNGLSFGAMYSMGDTAAVTASGGTSHQESTLAPKDLGRHVGLNVKYDNGPLSLGVGYGNQKATALAAGLSSPIATKATMVGGSYDFKVVKINAAWQTVNNDANPKSADMRMWDIGATIPVMGTDQIKVNYTSLQDKLTNNADSKLIALGYVHPMSKRTVLYGTWSKMTNEGGVGRTLGGAPAVTDAVGLANLGYDPSAIQLGIQHAF